MNNETEFKWTDAYLKELMVNAVKDPIAAIRMPEVIIESFKEPKQPKKEWEIVAYWCNTINNGLGGTVEPNYAHGMIGLTIQSVRRLSDGEVFSVSDTVQDECGSQISVPRFTIYGTTLVIEGDKGSLNLLYAKKRTPLFTTEDGVQVFEGQLFWALSHWSPKEYRAEKESSNYDFRKRFSNREKAEEYVLMNKPCLSVNGIMGEIEKRAAVPLKELLIELSKQKQQ